MTLKRPIIFVIAFLTIFVSVALAGSVFQKAQDAGVSAIVPGFVPSTGQINDGM
jgi:hypothetical protein